MARQSVILLDNTEELVNITGPSVKAAGYYGSSTNLHTVAVYAQDFSGRLKIQGTLASTPDNTDWFDIPFDNGISYHDYPYDTNQDVGSRGVTGVFTYNFVGNFVYVRAVVDRSNLSNPNTTNYGSLLKILLNF